MRLTVGMATYDDYDGVYFTLQSLRFHHDCSKVELVIVDNKPESQSGKLIDQLVTKWISGKGNLGARYVPMADPVGTTAPRERVFQEATGDAVLCLDSHVLLAPGAIERLLDWYDSNPESLDLLSGPLLYDDLTSRSTHFQDVWRAEMWGIWGTDDRGLDPDAAAFEIPAMGLGLFTCRREAWLHFNPHFRGFGGEEFYIHEKFRQAGRRNLCLPFLGWTHRFGRPGGVEYPLTRWNRVRNYVLGHQEISLPLDRVREHFVDGGLLSAYQWDYLLEDPLSHVQPPKGGLTIHNWRRPAGDSI